MVKKDKKCVHNWRVIPREINLVNMTVKEDHVEYTFYCTKCCSIKRRRYIREIIENNTEEQVKVNMRYKYPTYNNECDKDVRCR